MNPSKVRRDRLVQLTDLPNIGPAMAGEEARPWWAYAAERQQHRSEHVTLFA